MKARIIFLVLVLFASLAIAGEEKDDRPFCKTVAESAEWVLAKLPAETTLQVARMPKEELILLHFGLGMWIRNNVPVWGNVELRKSVGKDVHPDSVGEMILEQYWQLSRRKLPEDERKRIELFESTLGKLKGKKPTAKTHEGVLGELNAQIQAAWPKGAQYPPFILKADKDTQFNWEPGEMTDDLEGNVKLFIGFHRSAVFYDGDYLRVGEPNSKRQAEPSDAPNSAPPSR